MRKHFSLMSRQELPALDHTGVGDDAMIDMSTPGGGNHGQNDQLALCFKNS